MPIKVREGGAWVQVSDGVNGSDGGGGFVTGMIMMFSGTTAPTGWVLCDNSAAAQAANAPDLRDRFIVGAGSGYAVGATGGVDSVTLTESQIPSHRHTMPGDDQLSFGNGVGGWSATSVGNFGYDATSSSSGGNGTMWLTGSTGGSQAHENRPPYYALAFIMKT
jgi:microcystin-dependent protein